MANGEQWNSEMTEKMKGLFSGFVSGKRGTHIPVDIHDDGTDLEKGCGKEFKPTEVADDDEPIEFRGGSDKLHLYIARPLFNMG